MVDVLIIGGGLTGLINAIELSKAGLEVLLFEKKSYPFHRVCGEYISNEVVPYLKSIGCYPSDLLPASINRFQLTAVNGDSVEMPLDLGAFGISRYALDHFLASKATESGARVMEKTSVEEVQFLDAENCFNVLVKGGNSYQAKIVIGAFGKRSTIDTRMNREFTSQRSPYVGVKYHIATDFPADKIALHNFRGGYCGISKVENNTYNLCYLGNRNHLRKYGNIAAMEEAIVCENPHLNHIWKNSDFLLQKPMAINEISFAKKLPVERHIFMSGDAAGMITPLCGNGMAMAIHSAKILSAFIKSMGIPDSLAARIQLENKYGDAWQRLFAWRLWVGRNTQKLFGGKLISGFAVNLVHVAPAIGKYIMKRTHGKPF
ncbi:MAG: NAD(P)/FAD-dependent oxidoreductase [Cyclobacteriaceae bacterium]